MMRDYSNRRRQPCRWRASAEAATRILLWLILAATCASRANAQPNPASSEAVFTPAGGSFTSIDQHLLILHDPRGQYTPEEVLKLPASQFAHLKKGAAGNFTDDVIWAKLTIDFQGFSGPFFYLEQRYTALGGMKVFHLEDGGFRSQGIDENLPGHGRAIWSPNFVFRLPTPSTGRSDYLIRYEPRGHFQDIRVSFAGETGFYSQTGIAQLASGLFFGALLIMLIYNAFLYLYVRQAIYLYYCYYLFCFIAVYSYLTGVVSLLTGSTFQYQVLFLIAVYGAVHGSALFARAFLDLKGHAPKLEAFSKHFQWVLLLGAVSTPFLPIGPAWHLPGYLLMIQIPAIFIGAGVRMFQGFRPARWYILGWTVLAISDFWYVLESKGAVPVYAGTTYLIQAGAVWEAVVFSLSLGYRIKMADAEAAQHRENAIEAKRQAAETAEAAARDRGTFLGMISHELKSPLQSIVSALDALEARVKERNITEIVGRIRRASLSLSAQLRDILTLSQSEHGRLELIPELFDVNELILDISEPHREKAREKGLDFQEDIPPESVQVVGDQARIAQVLTSLLSNAVKYTDAGSVTIKLHRFNPNESNLQIEIRDTGSGIPERFRPILFTPFTRFARLERGREGAGLGLAIVQTLLKHLGGQIELASAEGQGTAIKVTIPVTPGVSVPESVSKNQNAASILVVDDRSDVLESIQHVILDLGHQCDLANSAAIALNMLTHRQYDLVLMDLDMPVKSGPELAIEIRRSSGPNRDTPLIAFSAAANVSLGRAWPFVDFLEKPVTKSLLQASISKHFQRDARTTPLIR